MHGRILPRVLFVSRFLFRTFVIVIFLLPRLPPCVATQLLHHCSATPHFVRLFLLLLFCNTAFSLFTFRQHHPLHCYHVLYLGHHTCLCCTFIHTATTHYCHCPVPFATNALHHPCLCPLPPVPPIPHILFIHACSAFAIVVHSCTFTFYHLCL